MSTAEMQFWGACLLLVCVTIIVTVVERDWPWKGPKS